MFRLWGLLRAPLGEPNGSPLYQSMRGCARRVSYKSMDWRCSYRLREWQGRGIQILHMMLSYRQFMDVGTKTTSESLVTVTKNMSPSRTRLTSSRSHMAARSALTLSIKKPRTLLSLLDNPSFYEVSSFDKPVSQIHHYRFHLLRFLSQSPDGGV